MRDADAHGRELDRLVAPREFVRAAAADLLRRVGGRRLHLLAFERAQGPDERITRWRASGSTRLLARDVERVRRDAEQHRRFVVLIRRGEKSHEARRAPAGERQHARGERVERPGVADPLFAENPPRRRNDIVRRQAFGFVDDEDAVHQRAVGSGQ